MDQISETTTYQGVSESDQYRRRGSLTIRKLTEYIPVMIMTNISLLLINAVDRIVAGNLIGTKAMNSISIFYPVLIFTAVFAGPVASGISTAMSKTMGNNELDEIAHIKTIGQRLMIITAIAVGLIQIPIIWVIVGSYHVSAELSAMVWQYAIGCMICTPLSIISTVGTYQLQISGKMKVIMVMTMAEGALNLLFDLLFMGVLNMGVAGAGYGTACSNLVRCVATVIYMKKYTDFYRGDGKPVTSREYMNTLSYGLPDAAFILMMSFQNYFTLKIILKAFGDDGGVIYGLCSFCLSLINVLLFGVQGGMRPLMGLYMGARDKQGLRELMRQGLLNVLFYSGVTTLLVLLIPQFFYHMHGVKTIPEGGILSAQLFSLAFIIRGFDYVLRLYLSNRKDVKFTTTLTILGNATLPIFALMIAGANVPHPYIFLSYLFTEILVFVLSLIRYLHLRAIDDKEKDGSIVLYLTVNRDQAIDASRYIRKFAEEHNIDKRVSYRVALCMEEMVAYIKDSNEFSLISTSDLSSDIIIRFVSPHEAIFITLDDGAFIALDKDEEKQALITDNYSLIKKVAKDVEYQYVLNMNYTKITVA